METLWANQSFAGEYTVLCLRLRPYSCGHEINLCQVQSPFIFGGQSDLEDLSTAALLCSQTFEEGQKLIRNPKKVRGFGWLWRLLLMGRALEMFPVELQKFRGYLSAGCWAPETNRVVGPGTEMRTLKAPRVYRLVPFLCAHLGLTEIEALNFPIARANAYYAALADKAGEIDLQDEGDPLMRHLADLEARAGKGENVWES